MLSNFLWGIIVILFFFFMIWLDKRRQDYRRSIHFKEYDAQEKELENTIKKEKSQSFPPNGMGGEM
ncbi:hypothetical protein RZN22_11745 [Bacillaceae bacterium S4-13-58]